MGSDAGWLLFLAAAVIVMARAAAVAGEANRAPTAARRTASVRATCRLVAVSGLTLVPSALALAGGPHWPVGALIVALGSITAAGGRLLVEHIDLAIDPGCAWPVRRRHEPD